MSSPIFHMIEAVAEPPIRIYCRSPRQARKDHKVRDRVCLMLVLGMDEHLRPDGTPVVPVEVVVLNDHYRAPSSDWRYQSAWAWEAEAVGIDDALGLGYGGLDADQWMRTNKVALYQKFAIEFTVHSWRDYWGEYDSESDFKIIWRGEPDVHALEQAMARSRLLALLEVRCDRWNLPREHIF